ncbi:MAG: hypothetical protein H3C64_04215 [Candidatus Kuenenia stuttgartiensis]|nr:hypothetical protein [Candidatus Kuenenia stuttgartiensis]
MKLVIFVFFLIGSNISFSQNVREKMDELALRIQKYSPGDEQTSVYITTNKDIYIAGEDLWFNAFVLNATDFRLSARDKNLYLKLQQSGSDSVVWKEVYPINNGLSYGHVYLPQSLTGGDYLLKAYTAHSFFTNQSYLYSVTPVRIVKEARAIAKNNEGQHEGTTHKPEPIQFNLFPEGGTLVAGLPGNVSFKAVNKEGQPEEVTGKLMKGDTSILSFRSVHAGMGSFLFTPEKDAVYTVQLDGYPDSLYKLPVVQEAGLVMRLISMGNDSLLFKVYSNHTGYKKRIFIRLQIRGMVQRIATAEIKDSLLITLPVNNSPQGIAEATLFDDQLRPVAERLVFLHADQQLNICVDQVKDHYAPKEKVTLKIRTTDQQDKPVPAVLSTRIYDQLFQSKANSSNIVSHYYLSTQLRGSIYDPSYYFDCSHKDRKEALDLLLLCQGWRCYTWTGEVLKNVAVNQSPLLSDTLRASIKMVKSHKKEKQPKSLMFFNYNKTATEITVADSTERFYITPANLAMGVRFYVRYFADDEYRFHIPNVFDAIAAAELMYNPQYIFPAKYRSARSETADTSNTIQYGKLLKEVVVSAKGRGFSDLYMGYLDSIAKYEGNTDYVGTCGWLNCPSSHTNIKPIEGKQYYEFSSEVTSHTKVVLTSTNYKRVTYHYPKYTEEDLLKKFKMAIIKGYYKSRKFYDPDYDKESPLVTDARNALLWKPEILTDKKGEATIELFCSDIRSRFIGVIEGLNSEGLLGTNRFSFTVR